ncbi:PREDICTED: heavy metal-associated isoprenylated plant protein 3 [Tarenaya hassleriana]|uniref:heavy metal-associated isoprenylated plant protein 3 n=1 Tax=Tarenaya hassleriana TaxID=28532 RepID=UPI00053C34B0|nr:PREDICTED: heavy metal-associated isoprenylated plant protein 3 [Tarenaya hassleriana]
MEGVRDVDVKKKKKKGENNAAGSMAAPVTVVLNVDMHCDGCTSRIVRLARRLEGAEKVRAEPASNKLTVIGFVDPSEIAEKLQKKSKKKVELISPPLPKNENKAKNELKSCIKTPAKVVVTTAVLKLSFHCEGCIKKIHKTVSKTKGVYEVRMDEQKEQVTVTGTMDVESLTENLKKKLKRTVGTVPMKKEKEKEKKQESNNGDDGGWSKNKKTENTHESKFGSPGQPGFAIGYAIGPALYGFPGPIREICREEDPDCCCVIM